MNALPYATALVRFQEALIVYAAAAKAQSHANSETNRRRVHDAQVTVTALYNATLTQLQHLNVEPAIIDGL
jgi:hypothetical protein